MYKIRQFFRRIYNLYRWAPIIWRDQDWDHSYIFEILKFKLENQAEYIGSKNRHMSAKRDAEIMMLCVRLIDKVQDEYYSNEPFKYYKSESTFDKWMNTLDNEAENIDDEDLYVWKDEMVSENLDEYFAKYPLIYRLVPNLKEDKLATGLKIGRINEDRARKLLFRILEENIQRWWE